MIFLLHFHLLKHYQLYFHNVLFFKYYLDFFYLPSILWVINSLCIVWTIYFPSLCNLIMYQLGFNLLFYFFSPLYFFSVYGSLWYWWGWDQYYFLQNMFHCRLSSHFPTKKSKCISLYFFYWKVDSWVTCMQKHMIL